MNKVIRIYTGDTEKNLFEQGLHPESQIRKVIESLKRLFKEYIICTNSPYVTEAFNKFGEEKGYKIFAYYNNEKMHLEKIFDKFSKPFEGLIFGGSESNTNTTGGKN